MLLFGKKKETQNETTFVCSCEYGCNPPETADGICCIKVLGSGCKGCHTLYENTKNAVNAFGIQIEVEYITDIQKVMEYGVMSMPALVVNDQIVSMGKVLKTADVEKLIKMFL